MRSAWRFAQMRCAWRFAGTHVLRDGLRQLRSAWRFAAAVFCMAVAFALCYSSFFVILSLTQNLRDGCEFVDAESSSA